MEDTTFKCSALHCLQCENWCDSPDCELCVADKASKGIETPTPAFKYVHFIGGNSSGNGLLWSGTDGPVLFENESYWPVEFVVKMDLDGSNQEKKFTVLIEEKLLDYLSHNSPINKDGSLNLMQGLWNG